MCVDSDGVQRTQGMDGAYIDAIAERVGVVDLMVPVVTPQDTRTYEALRAYSHRPSRRVNVVPIPDHFDRKGGFQLRATLARVGRQLAEISRAMDDADLVMVFMPTYRAALATLLARRRRKKVLVYHGNWWARGVRSDFRWSGWRRAMLPIYIGGAWAMERLTMLAANARLVTGSSMREAFQWLPGPTVQTPPIVQFDRERCRELKSRLPGGGPPVILHVGSMVPRKNIRTVIEALVHLRRRVPGARLVLAGGGQLEEELREQAERKAGPGVCDFRGYVSEREEKAAMFAEADAMVLASFSEGFPRVIYEAMAAGVPVVASEIPEIRGGLPEGAVEFINPDDAADVARGLERVLEPDYARSLVETGHRVAHQAFSADPVETVISLIEGLLIEGRKSGTEALDPEMVGAGVGPKKRRFEVPH